MPTAFIIHGAYGNPKENWFPWLAEKLSDYYDVYVPSFPTPENQELSKWMDVFEKYMDKVSAESIIVGHSLGVPFILNLLEAKEVYFGGAFLVAGFAKELGIERFDRINSSFIHEFDWPSIRRKCSHFVLFHSDNDPYVPLSYGEEMAERLKGELIVVEGASHFNAKSGYTTFPLLLEKIRETMKLK